MNIQQEQQYKQIQEQLENLSNKVDQQINKILFYVSSTLFNFSQSLKTYSLDHFLNPNHMIDYYQDYLKRFEEIQKQFDAYFNWIVEKSNIKVVKLIASLKSDEIFDPKRDLTIIQMNHFLSSQIDAQIYFTDGLQLYLPENEHCTGPYLKGLLDGSKKQAFKKFYVNFIEIHYLRHFMLENIFNENKQDKTLMAYMPYDFDKKTLPAKKFFFDVKEIQNQIDFQHPVSRETEKAVRINFDEKVRNQSQKKKK